MNSPQYVYHSPSLDAASLINLHMGLFRLLSLILFDRIYRRVFPSTPISIDGPSGSRAAHHVDTPESDVRHVHRITSHDKGHVTINKLPDDVLLHVLLFDRLTYLDGLKDVDRQRPSWRWHRLVHVCRRWRSVVFASPNFLDLKLVCGARTRMELTDIWPPLPIIMTNIADLRMPEDYDFDAAVVHRRNRVCEITLLHLTSLQLQRLASAMQELFPALIHLRLGSDDSYRRPAPALPDGFLGGSALNLRSLKLYSIRFPALPKLLLSATGLVNITLRKIPHSGYISPEAIATGLAMLASLKSLIIEFESPLSRPGRERRRPLPPTRTVLPALTRFEFQGVSEYLEDLAARIDAPLLDSIYSTFFHQLIFDLPQLAQFMRRTTRFQALKEAHVNFYYSGVQVGYLPQTRPIDEKSGLRISCRKFDWQLSSVPQVFTSFFPSYMVEHLYIYGPQYFPSQWQDDMESAQWLDIFRLSAAVKNLYLSEVFVPHVATVLQELVGGRTTEVLPTLQNIFLEGVQPPGFIQRAIGKFVAARQLSGHPINVSAWEGGPKREWNLGSW